MTTPEPPTGPRAGSIRDEVITIVRAMAPEPDGELEDTTRLVDDLGYQSLRLVELTMALEETFDLPPFDRTDLTGVSAIGDVVSLIDRHLGGTGTDRCSGADS